MNIDILNGWLNLPWWGYLLITLGFCQITIAAVTLYLHRSQAHLSLELHPVVCHFFRLWLWLNTGMSTRAWVAIHRKHHAKCETEDDPHSPRYFGIKKVVWEGAELYRAEAANSETLERFSHGTPNDWLEKNVYGGRYQNIGIYFSMAINLLLFGPIGLTMWAIQMFWIPFHAAGGINGIGHYWGYRNYETPDDSTNITPWAVWIGGEELHNNHHAYPSSAKFSLKPWEFDIGWMYIRLLQAFGLAKPKKVAPQPIVDTAKKQIDMDTLKAIIRSKMHVMADYANNVIKPVLQEESAKRPDCAQVLKEAKSALILEASRMSQLHNENLQKALANNSQIQSIYQARQQLLGIWEQTYSSQEKLLSALRDWCQNAEQSSIEALRNFAKSLKGYSLTPSST